MRDLHFSLPLCLVRREMTVVAQLDRFLEVLLQRGAHELRLVSNQCPTFLFPDGERPASQAQPTLDQLLVLLGEIIDVSLIARVQQTGTARGRVSRPGLAPLVVELEIEGPTLTARFRPDAPQEIPRMTGAEPAAPRASVMPVATSASPTPLAAIAEPSAATTPPTAPVIIATTVPPRPNPAASPATTGSSGNAARIESLLRMLVERKGSDLHLSSEERPILRIDGEIQRIEEWPELAPEAMRALLEPIIPERNRREYDEIKDTDFAHEIPGVARFRANIFADRKGPGAVFRVIPSKILTAQDLSLSPHILDLCKLTKGLVLVTGPTGSGKSTTLTALVDHVNRIRHDHIITIEDPIEFVHDNRTCLVNQREVGVHTQSFKRALKAALREDPDIVLVGEMRDLETISIAIETAETGHLVFGTLHTTTAVSTIDRIIDQFPSDRQAQIRTMLSESLKGVIAQTLCKKLGGGRIAALEVLVGIPSVANLIREGKTFQIPSIMQTGRKHGMVTMNDALVDLAKRGLISAEEAFVKSVDKTSIVAALKTLNADLSFLAAPV